jgi:serine/threonine-protein kinase
VAGALAYAHARGVRHGDLRPKHVVLTPAGDVVASLGLLEALNTAAAGDNAGTTAITVGAPAYQSPEQIAGEVVADEPSDVYSLGCMLFEMLAGEPPFGTASSYLVLRRKLTEAAPSVRTVRESVPPALDELLSGCLARSPADRIQSAATVTEALSKLREGAGV